MYLLLTAGAFVAPKAVIIIIMIKKQILSVLDGAGENSGATPTFQCDFLSLGVLAAQVYAWPLLSDVKYKFYSIYICLRKKTKESKLEKLFLFF